MMLLMPTSFLRTATLAALGALGAFAQLTTNPIAEPIVKRGLAVEIQDVVRLPDTRTIRPATEDVSPQGWARVSFVRELPDGRRFANDSRGILYLLNGSNPPAVYLNTADIFLYGIYNRL